MKTSEARRIAISIILLHLALTFLHGTAHQGADVKLNLFGNIYVLLVITVAPLVAGVLLYKASLSAGGWLMMLSMAGSLVFGVLYHFVFVGTDNVTEVVGPWHLIFLSSAIAIAIVEFAGTLWGFRILQMASSSQPS
jgi:hypothetical protein